MMSRMLDTVPGALVLVLLLLVVYLVVSVVVAIHGGPVASVVWLLLAVQAFSALNARLRASRVDPR